MPPWSRALSLSPQGSPRAQELYEELKILEGEDDLNKQPSINPGHSPEKSDFLDSNLKDNKGSTKPKNKISKFFKSFKRKCGVNIQKSYSDSEFLNSYLSALDLAVPENVKLDFLHKHKYLLNSL
ncbi:hypothetical protein CEXT_47621 [Caerostris extrusa]|uniref:Uncharacterized protein n=1 Tax=Caerostris extrusa TaxID=172846 RepID=A0AAV4MF47_CAEEX|nr:hypothetical protein CEXT_47621 [Caerostris extrusa]